MGDLPFTICFDFETTTGDSVLLDKKVYVISYCQVYTFHPKLKLPKNIVLKSFQQNYNEITSLDHLSREHIPYFDVSNERFCHEGSPQGKRSSLG